MEQLQSATDSMKLMLKELNDYSNMTLVKPNDSDLMNLYVSKVIEKLEKCKMEASSTYKDMSAGAEDVNGLAAKGSFTDMQTAKDRAADIVQRYSPQIETIRNEVYKEIKNIVSHNRAKAQEIVSTVDADAVLSKEVQRLIETENIRRATAKKKEKEQNKKVLLIYILGSPFILAALLLIVWLLWWVSRVFFFHI